MKMSELRDMSRDELEQKLTELRQAQFNLKFQQVTGQLDNTAQIQKTRKSVAQILTVLRQMNQQTAA